MSTPTITPLSPWPYAPGQRGGLWRRATASFAGLAGAASQWYRMRRDARQLMAFDDRMLQDIGLSRSEIECAVRTGRDLL
jgi:uncharacterized protein YjiS (DUF1127 family)